MLKDKINLEKYCGGQVVNFPEKYELGLELDASKNNLILYYIDQNTDVSKFVELCETSNLDKDNRVIMVYEKGRSDGVNRDSIFEYFKDNKTNFKMRKPMLFSINDKLSGFCQSYESN